MAKHEKKAPEPQAQGPELETKVEAAEEAAPATAPAKVEVPAAKPAAKRYRVWKFGELVYNGVVFKAGEELPISDAEAQTIELGIETF